MNEYHGPKDYLEAAKSSKTSADELNKLARSEHGFVRVAVAANHNTPVETLSFLVPDKIRTRREQELALALAQNPSVPAEILAILGQKLLPVLDNGRNHQVGFQTGIVLSSNAKTPMDTLQFILDEEKSAMQFRKVVARETNRKDVVELLLQDRSEKVRKQAENRIRELSVQLEQTKRLSQNKEPVVLNPEENENVN